MQTVTKLPLLRSAIERLREKRATIALVPTMGALHEGHLALVRAAASQANHVVASIFVNPKQFGTGEDLDAYPRQMEQDEALLRAEGVALVWAPSAEVMYPPGYSTNISVANVSEGLCGADRPGHFDGVATVVCKLFNQVRPDMAFFGEKDWQQLAVIRRMARDLDIVQPSVGNIHAVPTVREADGLAMSSRNAYLSMEQRQAAAAFPKAMRDMIELLQEGAPVARTIGNARDTILAAGFERVDYLELRDGDTLAPLEQPTDNARLFGAARMGGTRLIDNMPVWA